MDPFTVICRREHATFKVSIAAETAEEAVREAKARAHDVDQVIRAGVWTRGRTGELARQLESAKPAARGCACGYSLVGLPDDKGWVVCPECGVRQMRVEAAAQFRERRREGRGKGGCERCGYSLEGLPEDNGWVVCPECGGWQDRAARGQALGR
ncbi:MAG: hypothetical protein WD749_08555 [Phycisphaerales bacterium]